MTEAQKPVRDAASTAIVPIGSDYMLGENEESQVSTENPLSLLANRLYGRWKAVVILGLILSPILMTLGYVLAPIKYRSESFLVVESSLPALVEETLETGDIKQFDAFVLEKAQQVRDTQVFLGAFEDPRLMAFLPERPNLKQELYENLSVVNPRRSPLVIVGYEDSDPEFAAATVNAIVGAYETIYQPDPLKEYKVKVDQIDALIAASRSKLNEYKVSRNAIAVDVRFGHTNPLISIEENIDLIRELNLEMAEVEAQITRLQEQYAIQVSAEREAAGDGSTAPEEQSAEPTPTSRLEPDFQMLVGVDALLETLQEEVDQLRIEYEITSQRFGEAHYRHRRDKSRYESKLANLNGRMNAARSKWLQGPGRQSTWAALNLRKKNLEDDINRLVAENTASAKILIELEDFDNRIDQETASLATLEERATDLMRERDSIARGRVRFPVFPAAPAFAPISNKKIPAAFAGFIGGWAISIGFFFLLGSADHRTYGVRQLKDASNRFRVLGVLPNMDEVSNDGSEAMLATDCIHRIRGRLESRRSLDQGYAMMVSSPFQGDGKTTLTVSLAWSYAESGYRTLLIDSDFIGRAMTHQFGRMQSPGLREVVRNGEITDEIVELGHPNLNFLAIGFDRRIAAANLSPRLVSRLLDSVRGDYDIIIFDSGPFAGSIEAMTIAGAVDGVILALRSGRSRSRIMECVSDIRSVGADYLGVVLNYANRYDCERYGSSSSTSRSAELREDDSETLRNPLLKSVSNLVD